MQLEGLQQLRHRLEIPMAAVAVAGAEQGFFFPVFPFFFFSNHHLISFMSGVGKKKTVGMKSQFAPGGEKWTIG